MGNIELGHSLITFVEPQREGLAEYNRWYEHDHAYAAVVSAPGCFAYRRFVATRDLKVLRYPDNSAVAQPVGKGSYIAMYWFEIGRAGDVFQYSARVSGELAKVGRMNTERPVEHVSTATYDYLGATGRGSAAVPSEIALDHPYAGLVVAWIRPVVGVTPAELAAWCRAELDGELGAGRGPAGQVVDFTQSADPAAMPTLTGKVDEVVRCYFLDTDPRQVWDDAFMNVGKAVEAGGKGRVELIAPFIPTIPGTDRYQDDLW